MDPIPPIPLTVGSHGDYQWLVTDECLEDLLRICPKLVLGKYLAVTAWDSGSYSPTAEEKVAGWTSHGGIAYSPKVEDPQKLPNNIWDEWYVFESPRDLGVLFPKSTNPFEAEFAVGHVYAFVNGYGGLASVEAYAPYFWKQIGWILPHTYIAESDYLLMIVTRDKQLFTAIHAAISELESQPAPA